MLAHRLCPCIPVRRLLPFRQPTVAVRRALGPLRSYAVIVNNATAGNGGHGPFCGGLGTRLPRFLGAPWNNLLLAGRNHLRPSCMTVLFSQSIQVSNSTNSVRPRESKFSNPVHVRLYSKLLSYPSDQPSMWNDRVTTPTRTVVTCSKQGKRKTVKAVAKRFIRTGSGKLKYWPAGKTHNMLAKPPRKRRQLRKARYANKTQLKTLNKMLASW